MPGLGRNSSEFDRPCRAGTDRAAKAGRVAIPGGEHRGRVFRALDISNRERISVAVSPDRPAAARHLFGFGTENFDFGRTKEMTAFRRAREGAKCSSAPRAQGCLGPFA